MPDLGTWANIAEVASLAAIVIAGAFAVYQLRADRIARQDAAAFAIVQNFMENLAFIEAFRFLVKLPEGWHEKPVNKATQEHIDRVHMTLETIGFAVYRGVVRIDDIEQLMGGVTRQLWRILAPFAEKERIRSPRWYEWSEWLVQSLDGTASKGGPRGVPS